MIEEENKKMYTALLQNQVLGIDNPYLLHEIHNSDENYMNTQLYSQMQRNSHHEDFTSSSHSNPHFSSFSGGSDASPF
jgi:hypothetical protein